MTTVLKNGWTYKKLNELGFVGRGKSKNRPRNEPTLYGGEYPFIQTGEVKEADLYISNFSQTYNEKGLAQSKLWDTGTLLITIAANIAETAILKIKACFPDSIVGFIADTKKADVRFIKYYIDTIKLRMQNVSKGTTQDNLSLDKLKSFDFLIPPVQTQHKIASILSAYDDLIENNNRRIKILEEMAQAIYNEWFTYPFRGIMGTPSPNPSPTGSGSRKAGAGPYRLVKSELGMIPEGWEIVKFKDLVDCIKDSTDAGEHLSDRLYVPIDCIPKHSLTLLEANPWEEAKSSLILFQKNDILFGAMRPYFHKVCIAPFDGITRTTCFVLRPKLPELYAYSILTAFQDETVGYANAHSQGATIPYAVWNGSLSELNVLLPVHNILEKFNEVITPMLQVFQTAYPKLQNLRKTRDLLLPKLISGEIDVEKMDISIAESA